jgi:hypothetical protein
MDSSRSGNPTGYGLRMMVFASQQTHPGLARPLAPATAKPLQTTYSNGETLVSIQGAHNPTQAIVSILIVSILLVSI